MSYTPNLKNKYRNEIKSALLKEFQYKSPMQVPVLKKICINQGIGAAAIGGLEYFPIDAPSLSFFTEIGFYNELLPNPFFWHLQGGIGVRVNF